MLPVLPEGAGAVVTLKVPVTPPMTRVALVVVEKSGQDVCYTVTVAPFDTVPASAVKEAPSIGSGYLYTAGIQVPYQLRNHRTSSQIVGIG